jgi:hypothetical protein
MATATTVRSAGDLASAYRAAIAFSMLSGTAR